MVLLRYLALVLTAIILIPSGAHFFELPGKIGLDQQSYFIVQGIYAGWALFAVPIFAAIAANVALYFADRRAHPRSAPGALVSAALIVISLGVFFAFVFPANQATVNWTAQPDNWETLRRNWEYGHAAGALLVFGALLATMTATVTRQPGPQAGRAAPC